MTDDAKTQAVSKAQQGPLMLSGRKARLLVIWGALLAVATPYLTFIPQFDGWRDVVAWTVGLVAMLTAVLVRGLVPTEEQEWFRQALVESEAQRRAMHSELQLYRSSGGIARPQIGEPR